MNKYINAGLIIGVLAAIYFFIIKPLRPPTTKGQKQQTRKIEKAFKHISDYFNPDYYKKFPLYRPIDNADTRISNIYSALHPLMGGTNEKKLFTEFEKLKKKADISYLASLYLKKYDVSLKSDIESDLNKNEMIKIGLLISQLSDF